MARDWYTDHLYKLYEAKFIEKFYRKELPQWVGWYNKYNQSFNYEVYDTYTGVYVKRIMPLKFPNIVEFSFIDNQDFLNTGLCIYRQGDKICWFSIMFGKDMEFRDDMFWTQPAEYPIKSCYYLYIHDVKHSWNESHLIYLFADTGISEVYVIDTANPSVVHHADMSEVTDWVGDSCTSPDVDIRLSDTAIETTGVHSNFHITGVDLLNDGENVYGKTRILTIDSSYNEEANSLVFKSNIAGTLWYINATDRGIYPPLGDEDPDPTHEHTALMPSKYTGSWASDVPYTEHQVVQYNSKNYTCSFDHTSHAGNNPEVSGSPWVRLYYPTPFGREGYSYGLTSIPTASLDYEFINWRTDADREWLLGTETIVVRTAGGFAYILLA